MTSIIILPKEEESADICLTIDILDNLSNDCSLRKNYEFIDYAWPKITEVPSIRREVNEPEIFSLFCLVCFVFIIRRLFIRQQKIKNKS